MSRKSMVVMLVAGCLVMMVISLAWSYFLLPGEVAIHFNAAGQPDRRASRDWHVALMGLIGLALPLLLLLVFWSIRYLPAGIVNIPHREYWLAPQRRSETADRIFELGLWFALLEGLFFLVIHWLVVAANRQVQVHLSWLVWPVLVVYLLLVIGWIAWMWRQFRLPG